MRKILLRIDLAICSLWTIYGVDLRYHRRSPYMPNARQSVPTIILKELRVLRLRHSVYVWQEKD